MICALAFLFGIAGAVLAGYVIENMLVRILKDNGVDQNAVGSQNELLSIIPAVFFGFLIGVACAAATVFSWPVGLLVTLMAAPASAGVVVTIRLMARGLEALVRICSSI
jgi:hypothetical protein